MTTATDICGSRSTWIFPIIPYFVCTYKNFYGGIFTTGIGFLQPYSLLWIESMSGDSSLFHQFRVCWQVKCFGDFYKLFSIKYFVSLLHHYSIPRSHIIPSWWCYINNWNFKNSTLHLYTVWGKLAYDSNIVCGLFQSDSTVNYNTHK